jgi:hypothetical protein
MLTIANPKNGIIMRIFTVGGYFDFMVLDPGLLVQSGGVDLSGLSEGVAFPLNSWQHVAVTRKGAVFSLWRGGKKVASVTNAGGYGANTNIKMAGDGAYYTHGYYSNFRFTKGQALWTHNFTPPTRLS